MAEEKTGQKAEPRSLKPEAWTVEPETQVPGPPSPADRHVNRIEAVPSVDSNVGHLYPTGQCLRRLYNDLEVANTNVNETPLHRFHVQLGAKMIDFAGWRMPVMYRGIVAEHHHTRRECSLFDVSHMGRLAVAGRDAQRFLQHVCTRDLSDIAPGMSRYSHICREDGGILDDVIVSCFDDRFLVVCNASNREKIVSWLGRHSSDYDVSVDDETMHSAMVALQGPEAMPQVQRLLGIDLSNLKRYRFLTQVYMTYRYSVFRTGYTGEDGVEVILPVNLIKLAMPTLLGMGSAADAVIKPAGIGARDSLRLEAGMPLYGHELSEEWDSLSAGQQWCVQLDKDDFIGADALRRLHGNGLTRRLVGLKIEGRRTARQGFAVQVNGETVGAVTSGVLSPTLGESIAMAMVDAAHSEENCAVSVDFGGNARPASVVRLPFYRRARTTQSAKNL